MHTTLHPVIVAARACANPIDYAAMVIEKAVDKHHLWFGAEGAAEYVMRIAEGDSATETAILLRLSYEGCGGCKHRQGATPEFFGYCGPKGVNRLAEEEPTCGCPVQGLACVASRECPQGRWSRCQRRAAPQPVTILGK